MSFARFGDETLPQELMGLLPWGYRSVVTPGVLQSAVVRWIEHESPVGDWKLVENNYERTEFDPVGQEYGVWVSLEKLKDWEERVMVRDRIVDFVSASSRLVYREESNPRIRVCIVAAVSDLILDERFRDLFPFFVAAFQEGYYPDWDEVLDCFEFYPTSTSGPLRTLRYPRSRLAKDPNGVLFLDRKFLKSLMWMS